jgi:hypothetical protein
VCSFSVLQALPARRSSGLLLSALCLLSAPRPATPDSSSAAAATAAAGSAASMCGAWRVREAATRAMAPFVAAEASRGGAARAALAAESLLPSALEALRDPVAAVRHAAAAALAPLLAAADAGASATSSPASSPASAAAEAVASAGHLDDACATLRRFASSPDYLERQAFVAACDALAGLACAPPDAAGGVSNCAASARRLMTREFAPLLLSLAEDGVPAVRCAVGRALGRRFEAGRAEAEASGLGAGSEPRAALARLACDEDAETRRGACDGAAAAAAAARESGGGAASGVSGLGGGGGGAQPARAKMPLKVGLLQRRAGVGADGGGGGGSSAGLVPPMPTIGRAASAAEGSGSLGPGRAPSPAASPRAAPAAPPPAPPPPQPALQPLQPRPPPAGAPPVRRGAAVPLPAPRGTRPPLLPGLLQRRTASGGAAAEDESPRAEQEGRGGGGGSVSPPRALSASLRRVSLDRGAEQLEAVLLPSPRARAGSSY